jgi:hypothetical protein
VVASVAQPNQRAEALRLALATNYDDKPQYSVRELRHKLVGEKLSMPLRGAPFPMDDAKLLPDMGACGPCRFRTGNCDPEALNPDVCTNLACFHLKVKAQGERTRQAVLDAGGKVLRGEDARRLSPSVKTVYNHIDLDHVAEYVDDFPEKAPKPPKEIDEAEDPDAALENWPPYREWHEREALWQPRTYRALLDGQKYTPIVIEDPKTKAVRELLPFKEAQRLLKKVGGPSTCRASRITWSQALEWAKGLGGDLPNRVEQALLFAHHRDAFERDWYWSNTQHADDERWAWYQTFSYGSQTYSLKDLKLRARAVRRVSI